MIPTELPTYSTNALLYSCYLDQVPGYSCMRFRFPISPSAGKWSIPTTTGPGPPPCSYFSFTAINGDQAVLFGGRQSDGRVSDCYLIDFVSMVSPGVFSFMEDYI